MQSRSALIVFGGSLTIAACIAADAREQADTASPLPDATGNPDTLTDSVSPEDTSVVDDTTSSPDTGRDIFDLDGLLDDVDVVIPDVLDRSCESDDDCNDLPVALPGTCVRNHCGQDNRCVVETWSSGDECDDGDACTKGDLCDGSVCAGETFECADDTTCYHPTGCDRIEGCQYAPADEGEACNDDNGLPYYECDQGWYGGVDHCDGFGGCLASAFQPPDDGYPLGGEWFTVISTAVPGGYDTLHGRFSVNEDGSLTFTDAQSSASIWASALKGEGVTCAAPDGRIDLFRGDRQFEGALGDADDVLVFGGYEAQELGIAVRPKGGVTDINGTYHLVATASGEDENNQRQLVTFASTIELSHGCITSPALVQSASGIDDGGNYYLLSTPPACFQELSGGGGGVAMVATVARSLDDVSGELGQITWRGVIAQTGNLLLLTRDDDDSGVPAYGTIVLVRHGQARGYGHVGGLWSIIGQRGGASTIAPSGTPRLEWGALDLPSDGPTPVYGWFASFDGDDAGGGEVKNGWYHLGEEDPRYSHRLKTEAALVHHGGWLTPRGDFVLGWIAPGVAAQAEPRDLNELPYEGSLMFMLRPMTWDGTTSSSMGATRASP